MFMIIKTIIMIINLIIMIINAKENVFERLPKSLSFAEAPQAAGGIGGRVDVDLFKGS